MDPVNDLPLLAFIALVVFFLTQRILRSRLPGSRRITAYAAGATALVVLAAIIIRPSKGTLDVPATPVVSVTPTPFVPPPRDVSALCRGNLGRSSTGAIGFLDIISGVQGASLLVTDIVPVASSIRFDGWAVESSHLLARGVCVRVDGTIVAARVEIGGARFDVAKVLSDPRLVPSAFSAIVPAHGIPVGKHKVEIDVLLHDGTHATLPGARALTVL